MKTLFERIRNTYHSVSVTSNARVTKHVDHCPHCDDRTTWAVRVLNGYVRCLQCGRNPMDRDDRTPMRRDQRDGVSSPSASVPA